MLIVDRLLMIVALLGLVAALGFSAYAAPPRLPASQARPAHPAATPSATPALPRALLATASPTRTPTPINVGNFVWSDLDGDGFQDSGEPGLNGITVQLWNSTKTAMIDTATTNSGSYTLVAPTPGNYRVRVILPNSYTFTAKDQAADDLKDSDINPGGADAGFTDIYVFGSNLISITSIDAGLRPPPGSPTPTRTPTPINVGNFVWSDLDDDGVQDSGEPGVAGVTVQLWNSTKTAMIDTATTNDNGIYTLTAPTPGNYRVRVLLPSGATFTPKDQGADDLKDSDINPGGADAGFTDVYIFGSNLISITTIDAGLQLPPAPPTPTRTPTPINIGNFVWDDRDDDGVQDSEEAGLSGVTVELWNGAKTQLLDTATTNSNGNYTVTAPIPGDYRIRVILPGGTAFAPKDQGFDDQKDSDINPRGLDAGYSDVFTLGSNVISTVLLDAGLVSAPAAPTATAETGSGADKAYLPFLIK